MIKRKSKERSGTKYANETKDLFTVLLQDQDSVTINGYVAQEADLEKYLNTTKLDEGECAKVRDLFTRVLWFARKQGSTTTTVPSNGTGQIQVQMEGTRLLAIMAASELPVFGKEDAQDHCI